MLSSAIGNLEHKVEHRIANNVVQLIRYRINPFGIIKTN